MDNKVGKALEDVAKYISLSQLAKSLGKDRSWLYHKMKNDIVNGVQYRFSMDECALLSAKLKELADKIQSCSDAIDSIVQDNHRNTGRYYTQANVFECPAFKQWLEAIPNISETTILEPFAGDCAIPMMLSSYKWACYDIEPRKGDFKIVKRDTIKKFPSGFKVCITNPPYLAKNSATRRGLNYPECDYDNLYKHCLKLMLDSCQYVAAIIPDSFIQSGLFTDRLYGVISIPEKVFADTDYPVCLALFTPDISEDFNIWCGDSFNGTYQELSKYSLEEYNDSRWVFNDADGCIGVVCADGKNSKIRFVKGESIDTEVKGSSRFLVRVSGLPDNIDIDDFIIKCNSTLELYRGNTKDVFLNSFKGLRHDGTYRKRIPFTVVRSILTYTLQETIQEHNSKNHTSSGNVKALILDFDHTIFNTDADWEVRKKKIKEKEKIEDWDLVYSKIPEYKLYNGWREVFSDAKAKGIKIAIVSTAKKDLIQRTLKHFQLDCDVIIGWRRKPQKPDPKLIEIALDKLKVNKDEVISIGDSVDDKQMSDNGGVRFIGAIWDCEHEESIQELKQGKVLNTPRDLLSYI